MKLLRKGAALLAAAVAALLAPTVLELAASMAAGEPIESTQPRAAGTPSHDVRLPYTFDPTNIPPNATWGSIFSNSWH